jgi:hypothetical protein
LTGCPAKLRIKKEKDVFHHKFTLFYRNIDLCYIIYLKRVDVFFHMTSDRLSPTKE